MDNLLFYNAVNVPRFAAGEHHGFICSNCGQPTTLSESVSHKGFNLWCNKCRWKVGNLLGIQIEMLGYIQSKGVEMEDDYLKLKMKGE